mmetsp:Transcript_4969/g.12453  ORF Transcript_4969/g.12453 Transcript_4969/m.12453 type:complete len:212 (+) Transcript_4969:95-730(+)
MRCSIEAQLNKNKAKPVRDFHFDIMEIKICRGSDFLMQVDSSSHQFCNNPPGASDDDPAAPLLPPFSASSFFCCSILSAVRAPFLFFALGAAAEDAFASPAATFARFLPSFFLKGSNLSFDPIAAASNVKKVSTESCTPWPSSFFSFSSCFSTRFSSNWFSFTMKVFRPSRSGFGLSTKYWRKSHFFFPVAASTSFTSVTSCLKKSSRASW